MIHIDGASGAFIAPFIYPELKWCAPCMLCSAACASHAFCEHPLRGTWVSPAVSIQLTLGLFCKMSHPQCWLSVGKFLCNL